MIKYKINLNTIIGNILIISIVICCLSGCKKESGIEIYTESTSPYHLREGELPVVTHGMLHFDSHNQLLSFTRLLEVQELDTTLVKNAYYSLGIDVAGETILNMTDNPICLSTENAIGGYKSARKQEEDQINHALNQGDSTVNSIIILPYWKTAINSDGAVHIGKRIYKYYENGGIAIVLNDDWLLYETIKNQQFADLKQSYNLIVTSEMREGWDQFFVIGPNENIVSDKKMFRPLFTGTQTPEGKIILQNHSWIESESEQNTYTWRYSDNTTSKGRIPNRLLSMSDTIQLVVNNGSGTIDTLNGLANILACNTSHFTITYLDNYQIRFELPGFDQSNPDNLYTIRWEFSNGTYSTSNPIVKTFLEGGIVTCKLLFKNGEIACQFSKPYTGKCGDVQVKKHTQLFQQCNQKWKLDGSIWVTKGQVGCKVKYLKRVGFLWLPAFNQAACAEISGTYIREVYKFNKECWVMTASGTRCYGEGTYPTTVSYIIPETPTVFRDPEKLSATLGIKICGEWKGWGYNGFPKLSL